MLIFGDGLYGTGNNPSSRARAMTGSSESSLLSSTPIVAFSSICLPDEKTIGHAKSKPTQRSELTTNDEQTIPVSASGRTDPMCCQF